MRVKRFVIYEIELTCFVCAFRIYVFMYVLQSVYEQTTSGGAAQVNQNPSATAMLK